MYETLMKLSVGLLLAFLLAAETNTIKQVGAAGFHHKVIKQDLSSPEDIDDDLLSSESESWYGDLKLEAFKILAQEVKNWEDAAKASGHPRIYQESLEEKPREKRSYQTHPSPLIQLLSDRDPIDDLAMPKSLHMKRSVGNSKYKNYAWTQNNLL